jgi:hypothetical protein
LENTCFFGKISAIPGFFRKISAILGFFAKILAILVLFGKISGFSFGKNKAIVYLGRLFEAVLEHKKAISSLIKEMHFSSL